MVVVVIFCGCGCGRRCRCRRDSRRRNAINRSKPHVRIHAKQNNRINLRPELHPERREVPRIEVERVTIQHVDIGRVRAADL